MTFDKFGHSAMLRGVPGFCQFCVVHLKPTYNT